MMKSYLVFWVIYCFSFLTLSHAGEADVNSVEARKLNNDTWHFSVTVFHADTGWKHYANKWDVVGEDATVYGTRILHHPHVNEQPFTRSLSGVEIPDRVKNVIVRAHDSVHKYGGKAVSLELPK